MLNTATARIDLSALRHNLGVARELCPQSRIMAMIKADGYGHGAVRAAGALVAANGFAVARLQEAIELRRAGIDHRLLLLGTLLDPGDLALCSEQRIDVTAHDEPSLAAIVACVQRRPLRVWLKLDCGMHRLGLDTAAFAAAARQLSAQAAVSELVHMTHFSTTREMHSATMLQQIARFRACHEIDPTVAPSAANSAVLIAHPELRTGWVRPGIMLYGENPLEGMHPLPLRAVMQLRTRVLAVRRIAVGESVGYDGRWTSERPSLIATLGIGYGDGYPRHVPNGAPVWIAGRRAPLVGRVSMDSITLDVTDHAGVAAGDEAILWGPELPAATVAEAAQTSSYELFTGLGPRVTREYVG